MGRSPVGRIFSPEAAKKHRVFHTFTENPALLAPLTRPNTNPEEYRQNQTQPHFILNSNCLKGMEFIN